MTPGVQGASCAPYPIAPRTVGASAAEYASSGKFSLDAEGILVFDYGPAYENLGKFRNPYFISNYANALYRDFLDSDCRTQSFKKAFLKQADYLMESAAHESGMAVWRHPFRNDLFDLPAGWISGIGQARIASVLFRAYGLTGDKAYRKLAFEGMEVYRRPLEQGGVVTNHDEATWIEEYPDPGGRSYRILNGHVTALLGILDFGALTKDPQWDELVRRAIVAVKRNLPLFDAGFTSYYSLNQPGSDRIIAPRGDYNPLHVDQLLSLYDLTKDETFLQWASRFQAYEVNGFRYSAKGSVDPVRHGPDQANGQYGSRYWSHADFPTWIQVDLPKKELVKGFWIDGNGLKASPRDMSFDVHVEGKWVPASRIEGNSSKRRVLYWKTPFYTDRIRVNISKDNGNRNVAIQAAMPLLAAPEYATITNSCNYKIRTSFNYNVNAATDDDPNSYMNVYCPGWIIVPNVEKGNALSVSAEGKDGARIVVEYSSDMRNWKRTGSFSVRELTDIKLPASNFIRLSFGNDVERFESIVLGNRRK